MTTETKLTHTPGPWKLSNPSGEAPAYRILGLHFPQGGIDSIVGDFMNLEGDPEKFEYDAALISAAPDMLEALELEQFVEELKATHDPRDIIRLLESRGDYEGGHLSTEKLLEEYAIKAALARQNAIAKAKGGAA